jgi:thymidine phosphorylase
LLPLTLALFSEKGGVQQRFFLLDFPGGKQAKAKSSNTADEVRHLFSQIL